MDDKMSKYIKPSEQTWTYDNSYMDTKSRVCSYCSLDLSNLMGGYTKCKKCSHYYCLRKCGNSGECFKCHKTEEKCVNCGEENDLTYVDKGKTLVHLCEVCSKILCKECHAKKPLCDQDIAKFRYKCHLCKNNAYNKQRCQECKKIICDKCLTNNVCYKCLPQCVDCHKNVTSSYHCIKCSGKLCPECLFYCCGFEYCKECHSKHLSEKKCNHCENNIPETHYTECKCGKNIVCSGCIKKCKEKNEGKE